VSDFSAPVTFSTLLHTFFALSKALIFFMTVSALIQFNGDGDEFHGDGVEATGDGVATGWGWG